MKKDSRWERMSILLSTFPCTALVVVSWFAFSYAASGTLNPANGIGFSYPMQDALVRMEPLSDDSVRMDNPLYQRIQVDRSHIEAGEDTSGWKTLDALVERYDRSGYRIILELTDGSFEERIRGFETEDPFRQYVDGWVAFVRELASRYAAKVCFFEIWDSPDALAERGAALTEREYAFLFKSSAIAIKAERSDAIVLTGAIESGSAEWLKRYFSFETAIYTDGVLLRYGKGETTGEAYTAIEQILTEYDPSCKIWLIEEWGDVQPRGADIVNSIITARERGSDLILFSFSEQEIIGGEVWKSILRCHSLFTPSYTKSYEEKPSVEIFSERGERIPVRYSRYFSLDEFKTIIAYRADVPGGAFGAPVQVRISERDLRAASLFDAENEFWERIVRFERVQSEEGGRGIFTAVVPLREYPLFIQYRVGGAAPGSGDLSESIEVSGKRLISADEIIAKHQEFQAAHDERLAHYTAQGDINFHFKMGGASGTVDVSIASIFYWKAGEGAEWEQTEYFINGNRLNWKKIPELPLVQPEKVVVLPLDIHLDKNYRYEYLEEDRVGDTECYILDFAPVQDQLSLYRGKVWIDQRTYAIVKLYTVQTGVKAPIISSEETTFFEPISGDDGYDYWLMKRLEGQQIFSAGGRSFVVMREVRFSGFEINSERFEEKRVAAHASDHQILKDTDKGYRYFSKDEKGERVIKEEVDTNQIFAIGGVYKDNSFDTPIPLAGVNFFDYNFRKKGIQMNLFFAGVLATLNVTDADFLKSRFDFGLDFVGIGIKREDRLFERGTEIEEQNVKYLSQYLGINLGYPFADFFKVRGTLNVDFTSFSRSDDTLDSFVIPADTFVYGVGLVGEFNRSGYGVQAGASYNRRNKWEPWGLTDPVSGQFTDFSPDHKDFIRYSASASKEFYFPYFQKLRFEEEWMSGSDLDRFSKYNIGYFVTRVRGFGGSGIRFDTGSITRAQYSFNLFKVIRFDAQIDHAVVKDSQLSEDRLNFSGAGITANFVGPWRTLVALDYGYAVRSDIEELEGSHEFLIVVFKLF